jgi:hypothetical protein
MLCFALVSDGPRKSAPSGRRTKAAPRFSHASRPAGTRAHATARAAAAGRASVAGVGHRAATRYRVAPDASVRASRPSAAGAVQGAARTPHGCSPRPPTPTPLLGARPGPRRAPRPPWRQAGRGVAPLAAARHPRHACSLGAPSGQPHRAANTPGCGAWMRSAWPGPLRPVPPPPRYECFSAVQVSLGLGLPRVLGRDGRPSAARRGTWCQLAHPACTAGPATQQLVAHSASNPTN